MPISEIRLRLPDQNPALFKLVRETTQFLSKKQREENIQQIKDILEDEPRLINVTEKETGESLLTLAIMNRNLELVKLFVESGSNLEYFGYNDNRPLHYAVQSEDIDIIRYLLEKGADINSINGPEQTPIMLAIKKGNVSIVSLLCKFGGYTYRRDNKGKTINDYVSKTKLSNQTRKQIQGIIDVCKKPVEKRLSSVQSVLNDRRKMLEKLGTFYIPSQKTGQCYSDSFQSALYYADGLCTFFIEKALEIKSPSQKNIAIRFPVEGKNIQKFIEKGPDSVVQLYLNFTGLRFKNMVESKPLTQNGKTLRRRKSLTQRSIYTTTGEVCSSVLGIFNTLQKGENNKTLRLDFAEIGNLREDAELMFWNTILKKIPASYGSGGIYPYNALPDSEKKYVVSILVAVFPYMPDRSEYVGHAISINKIFGKWFLCDDNIGFAIPIQITIDEIQNGTIFYKTEGTTLTYYLGDRDYTLKRYGKPKKLLVHDMEKDLPTTHMTEFDFGSRVSDDARFGRSTRKYITWDPKGKAQITDKEYKVINVYDFPIVNEYSNEPAAPMDPSLKKETDDMMHIFIKRGKLDERRLRIIMKMAEKNDTLPEDEDEINVRPISSTTAMTQVVKKDENKVVPKVNFSD